MSRHLLPSPDGVVPGAKVVVGWDPPLATYFLQIWPPDQPEAASVWLGLTHGRFNDLDDFLEVLAEYGVSVHEDLMVELFLDRDLRRSNANVATDWRTGQPVRIVPVIGE